MKPHDLHDLWLRDLADDAMSDEERVALDNAIRNDADFRRRCQEALWMDGTLRVMGRSERDGEAFTCATVARLRDAQNSAMFVEDTIRRANAVATRPTDHAWRLRFAWLSGLAAAACLMIVAGVWWFNQRQDGALGLRVAEVHGSVVRVQGSGVRVQGSGVSGQESLVIGHSSVGESGRAAGVTASPSHQVAKAGDGSNQQPATPCELRVGDMLRQGERVVVGKGGKVGLKYDGEATTIELMAATEAGFGAEKGAKRVTLAAGKLVCSAAPQKLPLEIATRQAVSRVVGTRFSLTAEDVKTTLAVLEGKVDLCQGEKILEVKAGETATATEEGMEMEAVPQAQARLRSGRVWAWSWDMQASRMGTPVLVKSSDGTPLSDVTAVAVGEISVALKSDGSVWTWGPNEKGQLGDGTTTLRDSPVQVKLADGNPLANVTAIAAGKRHAVALRNDRTVWAWGSNSAGELGDGTTSPQSCPVQVMGLSDIIAISAGDSYTLALRSDATVWAWGNNLRGVLGAAMPKAATRKAATRESGPVQVRQRDGQTLSGVAAISAGWNHAVALKKDGGVWSWGSSEHGELGDGSSTAGSGLTGLGSGPASVGAVQARLAADGTPLGGVIAIAGGFGNTVALKDDHSIWGWGKFGLGFGARTPVQVVLANNSPLENVTAIGAGYMPTYCIMAVTQDGACWRLTGERMCQTSDGRRVLQAGAVQVNELAKVISVAGGLGRTLVLTE